MVKVSLKSNVEVDKLVFQDVGHVLRIGNDAVNYALVEGEFDFADDWGKGVS